MGTPDSTPHTLPRDGEAILALAARSMFQLFSSVSQGMFLVNRSGRIVWVNEGYQCFLPDLGFSSVDQFVGHMVEDVIPSVQQHGHFSGRVPELRHPAGAVVEQRPPGPPAVSAR